MRNISPARLAAFGILLKIENESAFSSSLLPQYEENLETKDRALCHELTLGVLRRKLLLDKIVESLTKKNVDKFDLEVLTALRLGVYQLIFLDKIPAYSAINESVNLVHVAKKRSATGLVNAVLRKVSQKKLPETSFVDEIDRISIQTSHPRWLIETWRAQFGLAETEAIANANNETPKSAFRFTSKFYSKGEAGQKAIINLIDEINVHQSKIIEGSFVVNKSSDFLRKLADSGEIYFQEEGSQLVGKAVNLKEGESLLDICAAPGSKITFIISKLGSNQPRLIVAGDFYEHRIRNLKENIEKQGASAVQIVRYDADNHLPFCEESFDVVLLDAPCSGTGTIRSNPEIRYFLTPNALKELPEKQLKFLKNASKLIKSGGRLIYSTCSLETQENEEVIEKFLESEVGFEKGKSNLAEELLTGRGFYRTFPNRDKVDGFFVAVLSKS
jgi:16S rRNA (cytosine967-C5)-methyltransferase